jgi:hypothetical protein
VFTREDARWQGSTAGDFAVELVAVLPEWIRLLAERTGMTAELTERCLAYASGEREFPGLLDERRRPDLMARVVE